MHTFLIALLLVAFVIVALAMRSMRTGRPMFAFGRAAGNTGRHHGHHAAGSLRRFLTKTTAGRTLSYVYDWTTSTVGRATSALAKKSGAYLADTYVGNRIKTWRSALFTFAKTNTFGRRWMQVGHGHQRRHTRHQRQGTQVVKRTETEELVTHAG